jgi:hypothetical protein
LGAGIFGLVFPFVTLGFFGVKAFIVAGCLVAFLIHLANAITEDVRDLHR